MPASALPAACLFAAAILWGLCIPVMKALVAEQGLLAPELGSLPASLASLAVRFGIAALVLMGAARIAPWRLNRREWGHGAALAAFTAVSMFLQVDGLNYTLASTAGFLIALYSVLVPLFAWAARWRPMTPLLAACCLLVLAGMAVLTGFDPRRVALGRGEWENIGAACLFADGVCVVPCRTGSHYDDCPKGYACSAFPFDDGGTDATAFAGACEGFDGTCSRGL